MALTGNIKPFGLRDVKLTTIDGATQVDLPSARQLTFRERFISGELRGDDALSSVVSFAEAVEWELQAGGISLDALAIITGRTATEAGTTPSQTQTMEGVGAEAMPYFKIYGKSLGDGIDDIHVKINKCKVTSIEGTFQDGEFVISQCSGIGIDDGTNVWEMVQNETAADLPSS